MRKRGLRVDPGSRLEYVVTTNGGIKAKLFEKIEDPDYQQKHSSVVKIDPLYYLKLAVNPLDQALEVQYGLKNFASDQYKLRVKKYKYLEELKKHFEPKISFT